MAVARSYEKLEQLCEPFEENKRMYVKVRTLKGEEKKVRWYTDTERARMDKTTTPAKDLMDFNARHAFGFDEKGYITLYKGEHVKEWAEIDRTNIWYNLTFGYYTPSQFPTPTLLMGVTPVQLKWEDVMDHDDRMKPHEEVAKLVSDLLSLSTAKSNSAYQGQPDEWLEKDLYIEKNKTMQDHYGEKHKHFMRDAEGNMYVWETGTKNFAVGLEIRLRMKVKMHRKIDGEECTIVWYCKEK